MDGEETTAPLLPDAAVAAVAGDVDIEVERRPERPDAGVELRDESIAPVGCGLDESRTDPLSAPPPADRDCRDLLAVESERAEHALRFGPCTLGVGLRDGDQYVTTVDATPETGGVDGEGGAIEDVQHVRQVRDRRLPDAHVVPGPLT